MLDHRLRSLASISLVLGQHLMFSGELDYVKRADDPLMTKIESEAKMRGSWPSSVSMLVRRGRRSPTVDPELGLVAVYHVIQSSHVG